MTAYDPRAPWAPDPTAYAGGPLEVRVVAPRGDGHRLAVIGVVLGGTALLGVLLLVAFAFVVSFLGPGGAGGGAGYGPMRGTLAPVAGSAVSGQALADEVTRQVRDDGGYPEGVSCPATARVAQDVTTVCHGTDDGLESSFVVFFEDDTGAYTLLEI